MTGIRLVVVHAKDGATLSTHDYDRDAVTIGRVAGNDLVLHDVEERISAHHARLERRAGAWTVIDLGSTNGTIVNERRIEAKKPVPLGEGDRMTFGAFVVRFGRSDDPFVKLDPKAIEAEAGGSPARAWEIYVRRYRELFGP